MPLGLRRFPMNGNAQICKAAVEKMAEGFAIQLDAETGCAIRIFPDVHVNTPTGNINLAKAKELDPTVTALTAENAGALIDKAGVKCRVRATCMQPFTDLLEQEHYQLTRTGIETKAYVQKKDSTGTGTDTGGNAGGNGGGSNEGDPNEE